MGMKVLRTFEQSEENYSLTFLGFGIESDTCVIELTYNYGVSQYDLGTGYGHIAIGVNDCYVACADIKARRQCRGESESKESVSKKCPDCIDRQNSIGSIKPTKH